MYYVPAPAPNVVLECHVDSFFSITRYTQALQELIDAANKSPDPEKAHEFLNKHTVRCLDFVVHDDHHEPLDNTYVQ